MLSVSEKTNECMHVYSIMKNMLGNCGIQKVHVTTFDPQDIVILNTLVKEMK